MKGEVRRSQLITTYGVGSIVAVEDESFMVAGIDRWPVRTVNLHEPRLERVLGVDGFVLPPASEKGNDIPVVRFPRYMWCPSCKLVNDHKFFNSPDKNECRLCGVRLVPSRFVVCCAKGHITDFPYFRWAHAGHDGRGDKHELRMETGGNTASLRDIKLSCSCGAEATMERAFARNAMQGILSCKGWRPWLTTDEGDCDQLPRTLQRGASNVWFSITHSAISIPPWSEGAFKILNKQWPTLQHIPLEALEPTICGMKLAEGTPFNVQDLVDAVRERKAQSGQGELAVAERLKEQEYEALSRGRDEVSKEQDFVCVPAPVMPPEASRWFDRIMLVKRLREVRALDSFSRINPPGTSEVAATPSLYDMRPGWLPAIEVIGEGIFLQITKDRLTTWEQAPEIRERITRINDAYVRRCAARHQEPDRVITPRMVLVHSLAHALITQWSLDSGYPTASLRERLYVGNDMAGLLIYTATSDSAGSLGGVIAQAEPSRFDAALREAMIACSWCSADPLCIEAMSTGVDSLNLAACHSCLLLPEVSCEGMNVLLDRATLIGTPADASIGFFSQLV
jgi:hypothetical protein